MSNKSSTTIVANATINRKGIHSKTKTSSHKGSVNYKKVYKGQGR